MKDYLKRSVVWSIACASALVLAFAVATAGTAQAGNAVVMAEGGTTDSFGETGHLVLGGLINTKGDGSAKSLNITISYQDNDPEGFVCVLNTPSDFTPTGGGTATLTVSASDPLCFRTGFPLATFSNAGHSLTFKGLTIGGKTRFVATASTLRDIFGDIVGNVAIAGEIDPSGAGSAQAGGNRLIIADGGAVDLDDGGAPSGHMAIAGGISLQPLRKGEVHAEAKAIDVQLEYQDFIFGQHLSCHLTTPGGVAYSLDHGVGQITFVVTPSDSCTAGGHTNIGNSITFALYAGGSKGRIVSVNSTLVDSDGDRIRDVAVVGQFSTGGGS